MSRVSFVLFEREVFLYLFICVILLDIVFVVNGIFMCMDGNIMFNVVVFFYNSFCNVWEFVIDVMNFYLKFLYSDIGDEFVLVGMVV